VVSLSCRALISGLLSVGLVAGLVPARAQPSQIQPSQIPVAVTAAEAPSEAAAAALAYRSRKPVLVTSLTTESTQTWAQPDGTFKLSAASAPVRTKDKTGAWVDIDLTLEPQADGSVAPRAGVGGLRLSGGQTTVMSDALAAVGEGAARTSLWWANKLPRPELAGPRATYRQVRSGVDLVVEARRTGFELLFVVADKAAAANFSSVNFEWRIGTLKPSSSAAGITLQTESSEEAVAIPPAQMWDAGTDADGGPMRTAPVGLSIAPPSDRGTQLVLTPSQDFFNDPATVYPVTIDPEVTIRPSYDAYVQSGISSNKAGETQLKLGYSDDATEGCGSGCLARSFLAFYGLSKYSGVNVTAATLHLWATHSWSCTAYQWEAWRVDAVGSAANWANQPVWRERVGLSTMTKGYNSSCADGQVEIAVTGIFNLSTANGWNTANIGLKASSENSHYSWKKFASSEVSTASHVPFVEMTYNRKPNVPANMTIDSCYLACGSPATVRSTRPRLTASFADPDGGVVSATYEVYDEAGTTKVASSGTTMTGIASGSARTWQPPALAEGKAYNWRVKACDKYACSDPTGWFTFTVDVSNPSLPAVSSTTYPERSTAAWSGGPGQAGAFSFAPGSSDEVAAYTYQLNNGDAVTVGAGTRSAERLTANQQQVTTDTTGFKAYNTTVTRATGIGHNSTDALKVTPTATGVSCGSVGCTFASLGGDPVFGDAGLQLGMQAGHRYELSAWIYVPSATGLTFGSEENADWQANGLRIGGYYMVGSGYGGVFADKPTKLDTWQRMSVSLSIPAGATQAFFRLINGFATGKTAKTVYFDDLSLVELTGSTSALSITPATDGVNTLAVQARDLAGNIATDPRLYEFLVRPAATETWYWSLDAGAGTQAVSDLGSARPLTLSSGAAWTTPGEVGDAALSFAGAGEATSASPVLDTAKSFTVAAWAQLATDATGVRTALAQDGTNTSRFRLGYRDDRDVDGDGVADKAWCFTVTATDAPTATPTAACTTDFVDDEWQHLVGVYDATAGKIRLYVNGTTAIGGRTVEVNAPAAWSAAGRFAVGRAWQGGIAAEPWTGALDEVYASQSIWSEIQINTKAMR
jgi:concanavalin A-like lectin/glucanase superfamily protein